METSAEEPARSSWIRAVLLFVMHHAIAALAVLLRALWSFASSRGGRI